MGINPLITEAPLNEGIVSCGRMVLLIFAIQVLSQIETDQFELLFKGLVVCGLMASLASHWLSQPNATMVLPLGHVSYFSDFLLLLLPWSVYFSATSPKKYEKGLFALTSLFFMGEILLKAKRAPLAAILISFILLTLFFLTYRKWKKMISAGLLGICLIIAFLFLSQFVPQIRGGVQRATQTIKAVYAGESKENRMIIYKRTLEGFREKPLFGWGYGNYRFAYPKFYRPGDPDLSLFNDGERAWLMHPHNEILFQLFEGGIVGLALFFLPTGLVFFFLFKKAKHEKNQGVYLTLLFGMISISISTQFTTSATNPVTRMLLVPYFALAYRLIKPDLPLWKFPMLKSPKLIGIFHFICIFLGLTVAGYNLSSYYLTQAKSYLWKGLTPYQHRWAQMLSPGRYDTLVRSATFELKLENEKKGEKLLLKAHHAFPYVPRPIQELGKLYLHQKRYHEAKEILLQGHKMYPSFEVFNDMLKQIEEKDQNKPKTAS